ncbi:hypothetical protein ABFY48_09700 [Lysinibacillus pakistanensis]|uniref:hypothetical protein n=1 Tax=Lysinibacillus pakistanensis TaxID=759811 RepID=UPI003D2C6BEE
MAIPRHRCVACNLTFTYDFGLGIVQASSDMFRKELVRLCHGRSISDVAPEYELPYTTVEHCYYFLATNELTEEIALLSV